MLEKFLPRTEFDSYEDFKANYRVNIPESFNFGWDIVDGWAKEKPENRALVWCDDNGEEKVFTFADMSRLSNKAANYFKSLGLHKGSVVMMIMRRRYEYWICATALIKLGVIIIYCKATQWREVAVNKFSGLRVAVSNVTGDKVAACSSGLCCHHPDIIYRDGVQGVYENGIFTV